METRDHKDLLRARLTYIEELLELESEMSLGRSYYEELVYERDDIIGELNGKTIG